MYVACSPDRRINANLRAATGGSVYKNNPTTQYAWTVIADRCSDRCRFTTGGGSSGFVDMQFKTVLDALGETSMAKNTIVIFVSDHREYACCQVSVIVANGLWPVPAWN